MIAYHWESLATSGGASRENSRFILAESLLQKIKDKLVVQEGVRIVHFIRIRAIMPRNIDMRNAFSEIGLECIHAEVQKGFEFSSVPFGSLGVREVNNSETWLPEVPALLILGMECKVN